MVSVKTSTVGMTLSENPKSPAPTGTRRKAREIALQGLYALELSGNAVENIRKDLGGFYQEEDIVIDFAVKLMHETYKNRFEADGYIKARTNNWEFERIAILDRLILRLAICEFLYFWDIPPKVSIDEAIELSKRFSTEQSGRFVNGILDAILADLKTKGLIVKTGRGLKEETGKT